MPTTVEGLYRPGWSRQLHVRHLEVIVETFLLLLIGAAFAALGWSSRRASRSGDPSASVRGFERALQAIDPAAAVPPASDDGSDDEVIDVTEEHERA